MQLAATVTLLSLLAPALEDELGWPREKTHSGHAITAYQPQVESWANYTRIAMRMAVAVKRAGDKSPYYGSLRIETKTATSFEKRKVVFHDLVITKARFPRADAATAARLTGVVKDAIPDRTWTLSLDRVLASVQRSKSSQRSIEVNLEPPPIFHSTKPAVLVQSSASLGSNRSRAPSSSSRPIPTGMS